MAFYGTITDAGRAFEARLKSEGRPLIFQRVSGGSGLTSDPAAATDLMNERCAFFLKYSEPIDDRIGIYTTLDAESVSESFLWQQWGLWAGDGEEEEVLYLLSQEENGQIIDPGADIIDYKHTIILSDDAEVTVIANPIGPVTQGDLGRTYGVAPLDGEAKVPVEHLPEIRLNAILESNGQTVEANQRRQDGEIRELQVAMPVSGLLTISAVDWQMISDTTSQAYLDGARYYRDVVLTNATVEHRCDGDILAADGDTAVAAGILSYNDTSEAMVRFYAVEQPMAAFRYTYIISKVVI